MASANATHLATRVFIFLIVVFLAYEAKLVQADVDSARFCTTRATIISPIHSSDAGETFLVQSTSESDCTFDKCPRQQKIVNQALKCVSDCNSDDPIASNNIDVKLTVISFDFDVAKTQTSMRLLLKSKYNESGCSFGLGEGFAFQDETGKTYLPGGQLKDGGSFSLLAGEEKRLTAIYSFFPSPGETYTLQPKEIGCNGHSVGYTPTYGDKQFILREVLSK